MKLSRIIPLPTAAAIKLELNTRLQLVDFTRVRQDEIGKKGRSSRSEQFRETSTDVNEEPTTNALHLDYGGRLVLYRPDIFARILEEISSK